MQLANVNAVVLHRVKPLEKDTEMISKELSYRGSLVRKICTSVQVSNLDMKSSFMIM